MNKDELKAFRREMISRMEQRLAKGRAPEDDIFYCHPSEDRIVLSHAIFRVMTDSLKGKIRKEKYLLLLRQYQEEMLAAWLTESPDFQDLLHYCNVIYNILPTILRGAYDFRTDKDARKFGAICIVAAAYGGDMPGAQADELLDDIDFLHNRVKCRKIENLLPMLNGMVAAELVTL